MTQYVRTQRNQYVAYMHVSILQVTVDGSYILCNQRVLLLLSSSVTVYYSFKTLKSKKKKLSEITSKFYTMQPNVRILSYLEGTNLMKKTATVQ